MKAATNSPILDSRVYDLPVRSTKMLRSLSESGIHKRTLSRGLEVLICMLWRYFEGRAERREEATKRGGMSSYDLRPHNQDRATIAGHICENGVKTRPRRVVSRRAGSF